MTIEKGSQVEVTVDIPSKIPSISIVKKGTRGIVVDIVNGLFHIKDDEGWFNAFRAQIKEVKN